MFVCLLLINIKATLNEQKNLKKIICKTKKKCLCVYSTYLYKICV